MKKRNLRRASRRYEMMVHEGVPESPQPMSRENTYGRTPTRLTGQALDAPDSEPTGETAAVYKLRDGKIITESPSDDTESENRPGKKNP